MKPLAHGIYEALIDEYLRDALAQHPELRTVFGKIDPEEQPGLYASFVTKVLEQALREESDPEKRLTLCNRILGHVAKEPGRGHLEKHRLVSDPKPILLEITPPNYGTSGIPRPHTPLAESSLFTGSPQEPQLAHESDGTRKLFAFAGPWLDLLAKGHILFVDELDTSLHPLMVRFLIGLIQNPEINKDNAQLIFTTHDTSVLDTDIFRRDQVWFVEKDREQASRLYPLSDFKPRKGEALEKGYLNGRYGALPFIGELRF